jgi:hypothetical protein
VSYASLTTKQRCFVDAFIGPAGCCRAAAARAAGYGSPAQAGHRLYRHPAVKAAIEERMRELAIGPEEVLHRLSQQARASVADLLTIKEDGAIVFDLPRAEGAGKLHLIRRLRIDPKGGLSIELVDSHQALVYLDRRYAHTPAPISPSLPPSISPSPSALPPSVSLSPSALPPSIAPADPALPEGYDPDRAAEIARVLNACGAYPSTPLIPGEPNPSAPCR